MFFKGVIIMSGVLAKEDFDRNSLQFRLLVEELEKKIVAAEQDIIDGKIYDIDECRGKIVAKYVK